jgi:hypothetical protein
MIAFLLLVATQIVAGLLLSLGIEHINNPTESLVAQTLELNKDLVTNLSTKAIEVWGEMRDNLLRYFLVAVVIVIIGYKVIAMSWNFFLLGGESGVGWLIDAVIVFVLWQYSRSRHSRQVE